jgi:hypothetical protein
MAHRETLGRTETAAHFHPAVIARVPVTITATDEYILLNHRRFNENHAIDWGAVLDDHDLRLGRRLRALHHDLVVPATAQCA